MKQYAAIIILALTVTFQAWAQEQPQRISDAQINARFVVQQEQLQAAMAAHAAAEADKRLLMDENKRLRDELDKLKQPKDK